MKKGIRYFMCKHHLVLKTFVFICLVFLLGCNHNFKKSSNQSKPNIILINADDLGYGDLGCYGAKMVQTPNIDKLAKEGRMFTDAHSASAVCSPSRYGLLTGQYPIRRNFWGPLPMDTPLSIDTNQVTISKLLKDTGYSTACIGKWHLGFGQDKTNWNAKLKPGPLEVGFDYYFGIPNVNSGPPYVYVENHSVVGFDPSDPFIQGVESVTQQWPAKGGISKIGGAEAAHRLYEDEKVGTTLKNKAIEWMKNTHAENENKPFFLYLATTNIHHPFTPAPQFKGSSKCGRYGDFIHELDWIVGEVLKTIDEMGVAENTLVIFTSDNGGMLNWGGQDAWKAGHKLNGDLLGFKFGAWEGGHRIPMIARWPGKIPANSESNQLISHVDLLATFAAIVDKPLDDTLIHDSYNQLTSFITNPENMIREQLLISPNSPEHLAVRKGNWVYIPSQDEGGFQGKNIGDHTLGGAAVLPFTEQFNGDVENGKIREDAPPAQLYNLSEDPYQLNNVFRNHPQKVEELSGLLGKYRECMGSGPELGWIMIKR